MKTLLALSLLIALLIGANVEAGHGHHGHHRQQVLVVSPYAVPVGIPLAPAAVVQYQQTQQAPAPPPQSLEDRIVAKVLEGLRAERSGNVNALGKPTMFGLKCAACHKQGDEKLGKPQFTTLAALSIEQVEDCMEAVLEDRMPKGAPMSAAENGTLLKEFIGELKARRVSSEAPPPITESPTDENGNLKPGWRSMSVEDAVKNGMPQPPSTPAEWEAAKRRAEKHAKEDAEAPPQPQVQPMAAPQSEAPPPTPEPPPAPVPNP